MQLERIVLETISPGAEVPETAILDFIVAISVLPMATFTTISVLGGSQNMPEWMFSRESTLQSLRTKELGSGTESKEPIENEMMNLENEESDEAEDLEFSSRMIDTPFDLFGED